MFGAPLIVFARVIAIGGIAVGVAQGGDLVELFAVSAVLAAVLAEALGFLDLSYRTRGVARIVARVVALAPFAAIVVIATVRSRGGVNYGLWAYAIESYAVVLVLWLATRRHAAIAAIAVAATTLTALAPHIAFITRAGAFGAMFLVFAPMIVVAVLALFPGRELAPVRIASARIATTLARAPFAYALLAVYAIVGLAGATPPSLVAWLGFAGLVVLGYRARTRSPLAFAPCLAALLAACIDLFAASYAHEHGEVEGAEVAVALARLVAIAAPVLVHARRRHAIAVGALAVIAIVGHALEVAPLAYAAELAAVLASGYALRVASREVASAPEPTVAEVFA